MRGWGVLFVVAFCSFVAPVMACDVHSANETINLVLREIQNGTIDRVDVLSIPEDAITFIPISPQMMEESSGEKSLIKISKENASQLLASMTALRPWQERDRGDLRWGIWFLDRSGRRLHSMFFDSERWYAKGRRGYIDGNNCNFSSSLVRWVRKRSLALH